jgi:3-methyladenine DNA glycosylase AlkD
MKRSRSANSERHPSSISVEYLIAELPRRGSSKAVAGMSRFGIQTGMALGVSIPQLRDLARKVGTAHELAEKLWKTGIHEARILASMVDDPAKVSEDPDGKMGRGF